MISRIELKKKARELAFKNKMNILGPIIIFGLFFAVVSMLFKDNSLAKGEFDARYNAISFIIQLLTSFLMVGYYKYLLSIIRGEKFEMKQIYTDYKSVLIGAMTLMLLISIYVVLWSLLLIIPGIIAALSYSMAFYIMADDKTIDASDAITESKKMMDGYKWDYFKFGFSFIGWILLCVITFGIALIWTVPYIYIAQAMYYEELKKLN